MKTPLRLSRMPKILFLRLLTPDFAKMRQREPLWTSLRFFCEEASSYPRVCSFVKFGSDVVCLVNTLGRSGCFFNYISLNEAPFLVFQVLVVLILWRSLWWMVATIDTTGLIYFLYVLRDRALFDWKFFWGQAECH